MESIVNDFTINIATKRNRFSISESDITQSLFDMGVPVSGKNLFPSNISGLPTWYIIRLSIMDTKRLAIEPTSDFGKSSNLAEDLAALEPGTVVVWNENSKLEMDRDDVISYPIPMTKIARGINPKLAKLITNIVYVGLLLNSRYRTICLESAVAKQFKGKDSAIELNTTALNLGREYFRITCQRRPIRR